jgi:hypothetical protein
VIKCGEGVISNVRSGMPDVAGRGREADSESPTFIGMEHDGQLVAMVDTDDSDEKRESIAVNVVSVLCTEQEHLSSL